jgi:hypothetical protein
VPASSAELRFNLRLDLTPDEWKGPLVDVVDTAEAVILAAERWNVPIDSSLIVGLTRLVIEQHDAKRAKSDD